MFFYVGCEGIILGGRERKEKGEGAVMTLMSFLL